MLQIWWHLMGQPCSHYSQIQHTWRVETRGEPHLSRGTGMQKFHSPRCFCFFLEPNHSAATTNTVSCWHNHGAKAKPSSMLIKLCHQDFYTYSDFFFQSPYQRPSFLKERFSSYLLRLRKDHLLHTKYNTENSEELWKTTKCFSWCLKAIITLGFHSQMYLPWNTTDKTF